jgi:hypothetical protein
MAWIKDINLDAIIYHSTIFLKNYKVLVISINNNNKLDKKNFKTFINF